MKNGRGAERKEKRRRRAKQSRRRGKWEKLNEANCRRPGQQHMINNNGFTTHFGKYFGNETIFIFIFLKGSIFV